MSASAVRRKAERWATSAIAAAALVAGLLVPGSAHTAHAVEASLGGQVSGILRDDDGRAVDGVAHLMRVGGFIERSMHATGEHGYVFRDVPAGRYVIGFESPGLISEWWSDAPDHSVGEVIDVDEGEHITGIDPVLSRTAVDLTEPRLDWDPTIGVTATALVSSSTPSVRLDYRWYAEGWANEVGTGPTFTPGPQHFGQRLALRVVATAPGHAPVMDETSSWTLPVREVVRHSGADRYETSARISHASFAPGVAAAYIASGSGFADALAGAPAAIGGGAPMLLTARGSLPPAVAAELRRLQPQSIVILGGEGAVGPAVASALRTYTGGEVRRLSGTDRYQTAVAVSRATFAAGTDTVYLASGEGFADALAGGAAAGAAGGPLLLARRDSVPPAVVKEIERLQPKHIVILGGSGAINIGHELDGIEAEFHLLAGADRYETAKFAGQFQFGLSSDSVFVASGNNFPDALAGATAAGAARAPVVLVPPNHLGTASHDALRYFRAQRTVVLGGPGAVSPAVFDAISRLTFMG